ncbi:MAG: glycosyltransferase family 4 protein [bacterium]|nr:glycosyltransferase family 4 protein [bacterium]
MIGVVHLLTFFDNQTGGMERQALQLATHLARTGVYVPFFITSVAWNDMRRSRLWFRGTFHGHVIYRIPFLPKVRHLNALFYLVGSVFLLVWLRRRYAIIHAHQLYTSGVVACVAKLLLRSKVLIVKNCCGGVDGDVRHLTHLFGVQVFVPLMRRMVNQFIAISDETRDEMVSVRFSPIATIPNGVNLDLFTVKSAAAKLKQDFLDARFVGRRIVLFVGKLDPQKNVHILIQAAALLPSDVCVVIVGEGPLRIALEAERIVRGLSDRILFWGHTDRIEALYHIADVLVLPSRAEGSPNVLLEAMSCGLPVIASDLPSIRFVVTHGVNGHLVPAGDAGALAKAIALVLADASHASALGHNARKTIEERFSLFAIGERYSACYAGLVAQARMKKSVDTARSRVV